jgi:hypothetical protein
MKRALLVALPAVLAVGLVACGDDDDNTSATAANTTTASATEPSTAATSETSEASGGGGVTLPGGGTIDLGSILPGGSLPNLSVPDLSIPDLGSLVPEMEDVLRRTFPKLTDDQISCLADHMQGQVSMSQITSMMSECNIDVQDLIGG